MENIAARDNMSMPVDYELKEIVFNKNLIEISHVFPIFHN